MKPLARNITIKPKPRENVRNGVVIPDTVTPATMEWGEVVDGNGLIEDGVSILYFGRKCFTEDNIKLVPLKKAVIWGC